ncbi:MAG: YraN family protein [Rhizomicrobium sp.]
MAEARRLAAEKRGRRSETWAALFLRLKFYRILARRVRNRAGEIDLIARAPSGLVCFIEVKARADPRPRHRFRGTSANARASPARRNSMWQGGQN